MDFSIKQRHTLCGVPQAEVRDAHAKTILAGVVKRVEDAVVAGVTILLVVIETPRPNVFRASKRRCRMRMDLAEQLCMLVESAEASRERRGYHAMENNTIKEHALLLATCIPIFCNVPVRMFYGSAESEDLWHLAVT